MSEPNETDPNQPRVAGRYQSFLRDYVQNGELVDNTEETIRRAKEELGHYIENVQFSIVGRISEIEGGHESDKAAIIDTDDPWTQAIVEMLILLRPVCDGLTEEIIEEARRTYLEPVGDDEEVSVRRDKLFKLLDKLEAIKLV